jgi:hypothetical protein
LTVPAEEESFWTHRRLRWLKLTIAAMVILGGVYLYHQPIGGRGGGTALGLTYGCIAAAGMAFLMWYGIRKRYSYASGSGTLKGWLSAHVWIGVALILLVPMHAGFHALGWSVHSAPYFLMLATIASGIWGAYAYVRLPSQMEARREGASLRSCAQEIESTTKSMAAIAEGKSGQFALLAKYATPRFEPGLGRILLSRRYALSKEGLSRLLSSLPKEENAAGLEIIKLSARRLAFCNKMLSDTSAVARMRIWLYLHLPISFACVAAVLAHVFWALSYRWSAR